MMLSLQLPLLHLLDISILPTDKQNTHPNLSIKPPKPAPAPTPATYPAALTPSTARPEPDHPYPTSTHISNASQAPRRKASAPDQLFALAAPTSTDFRSLAPCGLVPAGISTC
ncbi:hypothetical protein HBH56_210900 [Parastagonospora nodorum]|uniref:Uncharacterized protein n=1 Tax=Phaeosphaeria nodorum (strain SN15 / ATCC MYA-4574 / FGSC 10173) TaxID=321614 RepID=A0A7U2NPR9_PHANO|nr:hypothetical protein HBH56_210900 [Parastagonospora nodorum]QRD05971.1 hypothetical protein JI435_445120 [Parastagonospora nodorum SN15]KAH3931281.1 hypothetical protein HBH54_099510 [Parastagonospora nodorum]KAH4052276.1 hypothetical protein HBH49_099080 [Parastagonospora nodorum]KAH4078849.1 hypothetical protein HBH46_235950 [Parastagonospora nodorum]